MTASAKAVIVDSKVDENANPDSEKSKQAIAQTATVTPITLVNSAVSETASKTSAKTESETNLIRRSVDEIYELMAEVHEIREELLAYGIHFHMLNSMIEVGAQDKRDELKEMTGSALEASVKAFGPQAIKREELERHLEEIIVLEKDLRHVRAMAKQQGIHMQALNHLTQLMRLNPGDKGVQAINTFVAYADAAGVPLDRMDAIRKQYKEGPKSVLPDVPRELASDRRDTLQQLGVNIVLGLVLTAVMMWFVL